MRKLHTVEEKEIINGEAIFKKEIRLVHLAKILLEI